MLAGLLLKLPSIFGTVVRMLVYIASIGAMSFLIGEALPRANFDYHDFPFVPFPWEDGGRIYLRVKIDKWKDSMPDMSQYIQKAFNKKLAKHTISSEMMYRMVIETCVAEVVHWMLIIISPVYLVLLEGKMGIVAVCLNVLGNLPFIMIQRYNRPRLVRVMDRKRNSEARKKNA